jgi:hypothetical protein
MVGILEEENYIFILELLNLVMLDELKCVTVTSIT